MVWIIKLIIIFAENLILVFIMSALKLDGLLFKWLK